MDGCPHKFMHETDVLSKNRETTDSSEIPLDQKMCTEQFDEYCIREFHFDEDISVQVKCKESVDGHLISNICDNTGVMIWPATFAMCAYLIHVRDSLSNLSILELGAGAGVVGILVSNLCQSSMLTDGNEEIVTLLKENITLNHSNATGFLLQWGNESQTQDLTKFDLIIGSDVVYPAITIDILQKLFSTVSTVLAEDASSRFVISFVLRDAKTSLQRLLTVASDFHFCGRIIPWQDYTTTQPLMGATIIMFRRTSEKTCALETNQALGQQIRSDLWEDDIPSSDDEWKAPFTEP